MSGRSGSRLGRNARDANVEVPSFDNFIYDSILDPEVSIHELASEWIESYSEGEVPALKDMVNFILKVSGLLFYLLLAPSNFATELWMWNSSRKP